LCGRHHSRIAVEKDDLSIVSECGETSSEIVKPKISKQRKHNDSNHTTSVLTG